MLPFLVWRDAFFSDGTAEHAQTVYDALRPQPFGAFTDPADMTGCDKWGRHPRLSNRLGVFRLVGMTGSHEVLLTNPEHTAQKFVEAARD